MASSFISQTSQLVLLLLQNPKKANPNSLKLSPLHPKHPPYKFNSSKFKSSLKISAITNSSTTNSSTLSSSSSTRTIATLGAMALSLSRLLLNSLHSLSHTAIQHTVRLSAAGRTVFFATISDRPKGYLNTPLTVVAAGMSKWLDIYCGVLMVRVLLSWFPNIPWDRQPLSAIRDLCDPYLNLFRNIIPPVFDTLDVSPLLAFAVLGFLSSILSNSRAPY